MTSLLGASWLAVRRPPLLAPVLAAVLLVTGSLPWQGEGRAVDVLHGLGVLAAVAWAACTDDPAGEVAAATPYPRWLRSAARLVVGLALVLPVYLLGFAVARASYRPLPGTALVAEAAAYALAAVAIGLALRAWAGQHRPSYQASIGLLGIALATYALPRGWTMVDPQTWGPPWEAALWRWSALALVATGVAVAALADPAGRGRRR